MSSSFSCLAILSLLALASHLPDASAGVGPLNPAAAAKLVSAVNAVRRQAGVPPVAWGGALAQRAKLRAEWLSGPKGRCDLANANQDPAFGVIRKPIVALTYFVSGPQRRAADAVKIWAEERRWYDAGAKACVAGSNKCRNYMDMVRPASKSIGCAVAVCASGQTLMICAFSPAF
uniref:SCP domain-containing protein n=1 Tax=Oryza punctata TaxID=4537 RepID=A0A0E0KNQ0_ORYPU